MHLVRLKLFQDPWVNAKISAIKSRYITIDAGSVMNNGTPVVLYTKQILFRGNLYYIVPLLKKCVLDKLRYIGKKRNYPLTDQFAEPETPHKTRYGNHCIYDPRTFGSCGEDYKMHIINNPLARYCEDCCSQFTGLIPPIVSGRVIMCL